MIDVVIVNWNAGPLLASCVASVLQYGIPLIDRIVIVDNGSTDGSESAIEGLQQVTLIRAGANLGFGKACNLGAAACASPYLLFLNPDACLYPGSLERVLAFMQEADQATVGICGVQLIDETGQVARSCARFPSPATFAAYSLGLDRFLPSVGHFMREWPHNVTQSVDHVIGAFYLVRREVFDAVGGFDERFFVYLEDLDFSFRARQLGWTSVYLAGVQAFHVGGGTSQQVKAERLFYAVRSRILYSIKHFTWIGAGLVLATSLLFEPIIRLMQAIFCRSLSSLHQVWRAYGMLFKWFSTWLLKESSR